MTVNLEQANALIEEYKVLVRDLQGEIITLNRRVEELEFELSTTHDREYEI